MSTFDNPFDSQRPLVPGCPCGRHLNQLDHERDAATQLQCAAVESEEKRYEGVVASAVMRAVFPKDAARRAFLKSVGASTALAALSQFFPLTTATEVFAQGGAIEKKNLKVGFIPITCATPIIMAEPMGFYKKHGLDVDVIKTAGWAVVRDKTINKEYDAAHMLSPMPIAITMGAGSNPIPYTMPAVENINGQAITLAMKHKDKRDPKSWKGFKFAVPVRLFDAQLPAALLRGRSTASIRTRTSRSARCRRPRWSPTCAPTTSTASSRPIRSTSARSTTASASSTSCPRTSGTAIRAARSRRRRSSSPARRTPTRRCSRRSSTPPRSRRRPKTASRSPQAIAPANYLNQPVTVVEQVLTGTFADGLGNVKKVPDRIDFDPFPWESFAVWIMTQMKRWGQIKGEVDYDGIAKQVYLATDTTRLMKEVGLTPPTTTTKTFVVMGKEFDPAKPEDYVKSFTIKRA